MPDKRGGNGEENDIYHPKIVALLPDPGADLLKK